MTFKYRATPYSSFQAMMVEFELEELDAFLTHVDDHRDATETRLANWAKDLPAGDDRLVDEFAEVVRVVELASETAIVFLYRVVEVHRDTLLRRMYPEFKRGSLERPDVLQALVRHTKKKDIRKLKGAADIEELRVLNNAVKHQASVTAELATRYPQWNGKIGDNLGDLRPQYQRLRRAVPKYLAALAKALGVDKKKLQIRSSSSSPTSRS
jgi:hypothetical protein